MKWPPLTDCIDTGSLAAAIWKSLRHAYFLLLLISPWMKSVLLEEGQKKLKNAEVKVVIERIKKFQW